MTQLGSEAGCSLWAFVWVSTALSVAKTVLQQVLSQHDAEQLRIDTVPECTAHVTA
jgi:hypothetical protein